MNEVTMIASLEAVTSRKAVLSIRDRIGKRADGSGVSVKDVADQIRVLDVDQIDIRVSSAGGLAFEGLAIHDTLKAHPARKVATVEGIAASAATLVIMAADTIQMPETAFQIIHRPSGGAAGTSDDLRKAAEGLDAIESAAVTIYANRTGNSRAQIIAWLAAETWFDGPKAKAAGFCGFSHVPELAARLCLPAGGSSRPAMLPRPAVEPVRLDRSREPETSSLESILRMAGG